MTAYILSAPETFRNQSLKPCAISKGGAFYVSMESRSNHKYSSRINALNDLQSHIAAHFTCAPRIVELPR
jgi:hypothetical protein